MSENVEAKYQDGKFIRVSDLPVKKQRRYESYSWTVNLEEDQTAAVLERLALARKMVDTTDALRWLAAWKTPEER